MHWVLGQKKTKEEKKTVCAVVETIYHFETCECAVTIKRNWDTPIFNAGPWTGANFSSEAAQKILHLAPDLLVRDELKFDKGCLWTERLPTDFIIHSSVNKLRDIYALHICCVYFTFRILIRSPLMHIAWVTITLWWSNICPRFLGGWNWIIA